MIEVIRILKEVADSTVRIRQPFIRDVLDDFKAGKADLDKAVVAISNINTEVFEMVLEKLGRMKTPADVKLEMAAPVAVKPVAQMSLDDEFEIK